jgi:hypothetical protein
MDSNHDIQYKKASEESRTQKRERRFKLIEQYLSSGKKQKEFCNEQSINYSNFQFWLKQYRDYQQEKENVTSPKGFIPIQPSSLRNNSYLYVIEFPNGLRFLFETRPDIHYLRELLNLMNG